MISVIIPCFNSEEFIGRAIESVLKQTYKEFEIILVDNGSSDHTLEILNSYKDQHSDIIRVFQESKKGGAAARNKGLNEARGEWVQFLDADDELLPEKLEQQLKIASQAGADLVIGGFNKYHILRGKERKVIQPLETQNVWKGLIISRLGRTSSTLWKKEALFCVHGWDEHKSSSQEYNLLFKLLQQNVTVGFSTVPLTNIYTQENSIHISANKKRTIEIMDNWIGLRLEIKKYLHAQGKLTPELERTVNASIYDYLMTYRKTVPEYVTKLLDELSLSLPVSFYLNRYLRQTRNQLRTYKNILVGE